MTRRWLLASAALAVLSPFSPSPSLVVEAKGDVAEAFIDEVVTNTKCMSGSFAPNPRNGGKPMMILNAKDGQINVLEDPDNSPDAIEVLDLGEDRLCTDGERGMHTVIPHPNFNTDGNYWLYVFYTKFKAECLEDGTNGPWNVVDRFRMDPDTLMLNYDDREEIWRGAPLYKRTHNGGAMAFGNDGLLYITTGDSNERTTAQPLNIVHGSVIRLNDDGTVPDSNPFTAASGYTSYRCADSGGVVPSDAPDDAVCGEIFATGLRNPFRIAMDVNTKDKVLFTIGDVGAQHVEELNYGGTDYKGANYGWPFYEGVCNPGTLDECPVNTDDSLTMPFHWYEHMNPSGNGGCVAGQAFVPAGIWPEEYKFLFIDFVFLKIYSLQTDMPQRGCEDCDPPIAPTRNVTFYRSIQEDGESVNEARMTALWFGPYNGTQALYVTKFGEQDTVLRIRYSGVFNTPPEPAFNFNFASDTSVQFDASASYDPENMGLTYSWDFGDGGDSTEQMPLHEFTAPGEYTVTLFITDSAGQVQQLSKTVKVGELPTVSIVSPTIFDFFSVGQVIRLRGEASDFQGNLIPDENLEWEVRQHHADHFHPFMGVTVGNDFDLIPAPEPEDYLAASNSYLEIILTASDQHGLSNTVSMDVKPRIIMVNLETFPQGLDVVIDDYSIVTPLVVSSWVGFNLPLRADDQPPYVFQKWSDGLTNSSRTIFLAANLTAPEVIAHFCVDLDNECTENEDCCTGHCSSVSVCAIKPTAAPTIPPPTMPPASTSSPEPPAQPPVQGEDLETPADQDHIVDPSDDHPWTPVDDDAIDYGSEADSLNNVDGNQAESKDSSGEATIIALLTVSIVVLVGLSCWCYLKRRNSRKDREYVESVVESLYGKGAAEVDDRASSKTGSDDDFNACIQPGGTGSTDESNSHDGSHSAASESAMEEGKGDIGSEAVDSGMDVSQFMMDPVPPMTENSFASRDVESGAVDDADYVHETSLLLEADSFRDDGIVESMPLYNISNGIADSSDFENSAILLEADLEGDLVHDMESSQVDDDSVLDETLEEVFISSEPINIASMDPSQSNCLISMTETPSAEMVSDTPSQDQVSGTPIDEASFDVHPEAPSNLDLVHPETEGLDPDSVGVDGEPLQDAQATSPTGKSFLGESVVDFSDSLPQADESPLKAEDEMDESMISHMSEESQEEEQESLLSEAPVVDVSEAHGSDTTLQAHFARELDASHDAATRGLPVTRPSLPETPRGSTLKSRSSPSHVNTTPSTVASMTPSPNINRSGKPWASDLRLASADLERIESAIDDLEA